jgi:hypothetical protein
VSAELLLQHTRHLLLFVAAGLTLVTRVLRRADTPNASAGQANMHRNDFDFHTNSAKQADKRGMQ